ncbi:NAD-dependent epimerase/dehydratase family protein [Streptomyces cavernicola]|uniref:NAD-dependent epimerase/dehydratase family protein n=1 Tax=Streptomyces cavernicola TaxID=3043613 RepID=A0ABT6SGE2_9ACTN|nr:NAD-dependent epimerase/dehydratase family protein [Streptomyces sp. B-S-A6]MDI3406924.1 NAD-dependent epimerase/dehydratase family protein [Streptomyces sp. B-S-A6]
MKRERSHEQSREQSREQSGEQSGEQRRGRSIVVTGATGNVGTAVVRALAADDQVSTILGLARRTPRWEVPKTRWRSVDLDGTSVEHLTGLFRGADAVIHLAWLLQPARDPHVTWRTNALGTVAVLAAVAAADVPAVVVASSLAAYAPGPKRPPVREGWPTHGRPDVAYSREKAYVERVLDAFEATHPERRVVRMRPGFTFQRTAAMEQLRLFAGPFLPHGLVRPELIPVVPDIEGLAFQVVHADDVAEAYRLAALDDDVRGAFNLAAEPVIDAGVLARLLGARAWKVPRQAARAAARAAWAAHLAPVPPQLLDALLDLPLLDTTRARDRLGWTPEHTADDTLTEFLEALRKGEGLRTPPLKPSALLS